MTTVELMELAEGMGCSRYDNWIPEAYPSLYRFSDRGWELCLSPAERHTLGWLITPDGMVWVIDHMQRIGFTVATRSLKSMNGLHFCEMDGGDTYGRFEDEGATLPEAVAGTAHVALSVVRARREVQHG